MLFTQPRVLQLFVVQFLDGLLRHLLPDDDIVAKVDVFSAEMFDHGLCDNVHCVAPPLRDCIEPVSAPAAGLAPF